MHIQVSSYLLLSITVFLHSLNDLCISFFPVQDRLFRKYLIERRSGYVPMALGDLGDILMFLYVGEQAFHKIVFPQNRLPLYLSPDCLLAHPPLNKLPVFLFGLGPLPAKLPQDPIRGQTQRGRLTSCCGAVAGPFPRFGPFYHPCPDRIQYDVPAYFEKMAVFLDENRLVPTLEQMARSLMTFIKKLSVNPVQLPHSQGEIAVRRLDQDVIVVAHQTIGMTEPIIPFVDMLKRVKEVDAVLVVSENGLLFIAAGREVINRAGVLYTEGASHAATLSWKRENVKSKDLTL